MEPVGLGRSAHEDEGTGSEGELEWCPGGLGDLLRKGRILVCDICFPTVFGERFVL